MPSPPPPGDAAIFEGMELADLSPALGQYFGTSQGVLVIRVPHDGDFLKLQDGDVILGIDGRVPENGSHATRILRSYQPGEKIHLKVMRQKKTLELEATLPQRHHFGRGDHPPPDWGPGGPGDPKGPQPLPPATGGPPSIDIDPAPLQPQQQGRLVPLVGNGSGRIQPVGPPPG